LRQEFEVELNPSDTPFTEDRYRTALREADALLTFVSDPITAELLALPDRRVGLLGQFGVGYNNIDVEAARAEGVVVTNTPGVLTDCTADLALTLLLMTARRAGEGEREVRAGHWSGIRPTHLLGHRVSGKTLGIIGMGRIGLAVARRAHYGFGMPIVFQNRSPLGPERLEGLPAEQLDSVEAVLERADFVSLHCPATPQTRHLIDADRLARMKPGAYLINTARGDVVDEPALIEALTQGRLAGAGLDVYEREPRVPEALRRLDNVVLLPHLGSATEETRVAMGMLVIDNVRAHFEGREPPNRVV
ncbi:MAG: D-glycerate dehydrogenase, partial [Candidatus Competibacterales bacterium]|nr:D-glycerate dehydrogenase [Candidatus Competibacterales bacterium]